MMKITETELRQTCQKVFAGLGFTQGDWEDCARTITWLEMHGIPILNHILFAIQNNDLHPSSSAEILHEDTFQFLIDAKHNTGLIFGSIAVDLGYLKALEQDQGKIRLLNIEHGMMIMPNLQHIAKHGWHVGACWTTHKHKHVVVFKANQSYPNYWVASITNGFSNVPHHLDICCSKAPLPFKKEIPNKVPVKYYAPEVFQETYQNHLREGLFINDSIWNLLVTLSKETLVESTELSRKMGAGDGQGTK